MRKLAVLVFALAMTGGALWLTMALAMGTTTGSCATALLQGTLVEQDGTLAVESVPPGTVTKVTWPFGYGVGTEGGTLVITRLFTVVAREGDEVSVGGGMLSDDVTFNGCGQVTPGLMFPPEPTPSWRARAPLAHGAVHA